MTAAVTTATVQSILASANGPLSNGIGVIVVMLLLGLLVERVILEAYLGGSKTRSLRIFDIAVVPLLILLCLLVGLRFASLLGVIRA
jgi:hypothetical protein